MTKANDRIGWFLVCLVFLSPIPLGSNRPAFWAICGFLVGLTAFVYLTRAAWTREALRVPVGTFGFIGALWALLCFWLLVQLLPLGALMGPFTFIGAAGQQIMSSTLSLAPGQTAFMLVRMITYGLVFFLAVQAGANEVRAKKMLRIIFWVIVAHAGFGLFQLTQLNDTILGFEKQSYLGVATGTFLNRNSYATFLAVGFIIGCALLPSALFSTRMRNERTSDLFIASTAIFGGMLAILIALLATQSRMGFFVAIAGALAVVLLVARWLRHAPIIIAGVTSALLIGAIAAAWYFGQGTLERVIDLAGASDTRLAIYHQVWTMTMERPWLGYGGGAFELAFPLYFGPPLSLSILIDKAHSTYLSLFAELGLLGGMLPILIVAIIGGKTLIRAVRSQTKAIVRIAAIGAIVAVALHSTVDFSLEMQANAILLTVLLGLAWSNGARS